VQLPEALADRAAMDEEFMANLMEMGS
jgi:hypothetical protein